MSRRYKYQVWQTQGNHVTYVNGMWQGNQALSGAKLEDLIRSCPVLWEYLNAVGRDGWELVSVTPYQVSYSDPNQNFVQYIFKRAE